MPSARVVSTQEVLTFVALILLIEDQHVIAFPLSDCGNLSPLIYCPDYGSDKWNERASCKNCADGTKYHCCKDYDSPKSNCKQDEYYCEEEIFVEGCAEEKFCKQGEEPVLDFYKLKLWSDKPIVRCQQCYNNNRYNSYLNTSSATYSECPRKKKNICTPASHKVECRKQSDETSERFCRCDVTNGYYPSTHPDDHPSDGCSIDDYECINDPPKCIQGQSLLLNYTCSSHCKEGYYKNETSGDCIPNPTIQTFTKTALVFPSSSPAASAKKTSAFVKVSTQPPGPETTTETHGSNAEVIIVLLCSGVLAMLIAIIICVYRKIGVYRMRENCSQVSNFPLTILEDDSENRCIEVITEGTISRSRTSTLEPRKSEIPLNWEKCTEPIQTHSLDRKMKGPVDYDHNFGTAQPSMENVFFPSQPPKSTINNEVDGHQPNSRHIDRELSAPLSEPEKVSTPNLSRKPPQPSNLKSETIIIHGNVFYIKGGGTQIALDEVSTKSKTKNVKMTYNIQDIKGEDQGLLEDEDEVSESNRDSFDAKQTVKVHKADKLFHTNDTTPTQPKEESRAKYVKDIPGVNTRTSDSDATRANTTIEITSVKAESEGKLRTMQFSEKQGLDKSKAANFCRRTSVSQDSVFSPPTIQDVEGIFVDCDRYKYMINKVIDKCWKYLLENMDPKSMLDVFQEKDIFAFTFLRDVSDSQIQTEISRKILTIVRETGKQYYQDFKVCLKETKQYSCFARVETVQREVLAEMEICATQHVPGRSRHNSACHGSLPDLRCVPNIEMCKSDIIDERTLEDKTKEDKFVRLESTSLVIPEVEINPTENTPMLPTDDIQTHQKVRRGPTVLPPRDWIMEKKQDIKREVESLPEDENKVTETNRENLKHVFSLDDKQTVDIHKVDKLFRTDDSTSTQPNKKSTSKDVNISSDDGDATEANTTSGLNIIEADIEIATSLESDDLCKEQLQRKRKVYTHFKFEHRSYESYLPNRDQLRKLCVKFGVNSSEVSKVCDEICTTLKNRSKEIVNVWPAYRKSDTYCIVFVVITNSRVASPKDVYIFEDFEVLIREKKEKNEENKQVINHEVDSQTRIELSQMEKLRTIIRHKSKTLRENHSNITMISASPFKSRGFMKGNHTMEKIDCVVLYVHVKGLIPAKETCFPQDLSGFPVDVREAVIQLYAGGEPSDKHDQVKMGCAIGPEDRKCTGTLGGFVEIAEHGMCAITCAHVLLGQGDLKSKLQKKTVCCQPSLEYSESKRCGRVVDHYFSERTEETSVDVAVIKLDKERIPLNGQFPDVSKDDLKKAGFDEESTLQFTSGKVYDSKDIKLYKDSRLIKYGATTQLRRGVFGFEGANIETGSLMYFGDAGLILDNLIHINDIRKCGPFSEPGDSGSLVFSVSDEELIAVGMLLGGDDGFSVVTPICDALNAIGCAAPYNLKCFSEHPQFMKVNIKNGPNEFVRHVMNEVDSPQPENVSTPNSSIIYQRSDVKIKNGDTQIPVVGVSHKNKYRHRNISYNKQDIKQGEAQGLLEDEEEVTETEFNIGNSNHVHIFDDKQTVALHRADRFFHTNDTTLTQPNEKTTAKKVNDSPCVNTGTDGSDSKATRANATRGLTSLESDGQ